VSVVVKSEQGERGFNGIQTFRVQSLNTNAPSIKCMHLF